MLDQSYFKLQEEPKSNESFCNSGGRRGKRVTQRDLNLQYKGE